MTFIQLECFMALAQRLNFTQAAADLFLAQPALSRTISALEGELGVQLFERNPRSVALTPAGSAFYKECPQVLDSYRNCIAAAQLAQKGFRGSIVLGVMRDFFEPCVSDIFRSFRALYPEISLMIRGYSHSGLLSAFSTGEVDVILNCQPIPGEESCDAIVIRRNHQCVIVAPDHPLAKRGSLRMDELKDEAFVVMSRTVSVPGHDFIWRNAAAEGFAPNVVAEATHIPVLLTLVSCGIGISTLGDEMECLAQEKVRFIPLLGVPLSSSSLMWHPDSGNPALPRFVETVRTLYAR